LLKVGLPTALFNRDTVKDAVLKLSKLGVDCIEIVLEIPQFPPEVREIRVQRELKELLSTVNVDLSAHAPFYDLNLGSSYREVRELAAGWIKKSIDLCSFLGIEIMTIHPGYFPVFQIPRLFREARTRFVGVLKECVRYGEDQGVKVSIENIQVSYFFCYKLDEMVKLVGEVDGLGLTLDIGHAYIMKVLKGTNRLVTEKSPEEEIADAIKGELGGLLTHIHIHDNKGTEDEHLLFGKGKINFTPIVEAIKTIPYRGQVIAEVWTPERSMQEEIGAKALTKARKLFQTD